MMLNTLLRQAQKSMTTLLRRMIENDLTPCGDRSSIAMNSSAFAISPDTVVFMVGPSTVIVVGPTGQIDNAAGDDSDEVDQHLSR